MPRAVSPAILSDLRASYGAEVVESQLASLRRHGDAVEEPDLWLRTALERHFKFMSIERVSVCPCGSEHSRPVSRFVFWNLLGVRECEHCRLLFISPRLTSEAMFRVFQESYFDHDDLTFWGERRMPVFEQIGRLLRSAGARTVFDVGTGFGRFVSSAGSHGFEASGSDLSVRAVQLGRQRLGVCLHAGRLTELDLPPASVDAVVSLDALYYVADVKDELRAMRRLVRPNGMMILRLRNGAWSRLRIARARMRSVGESVMPSEHLYAFTPDTIRPILAAAGWRMRHCAPAAYSRSPISLMHRALVKTNQLGREILGGVPIVTKSFIVISRPA